jgi:hypothetical protein
MILRMAGVHHFDPAGPEVLTSWLKNQIAEFTEPPLFVATEWSEVDFVCVKGQRPGFRQMLEKEWPHAPRELLDILELSLAYEGDAHLSVLPEAQVLWLAPIRGRDDPAIRDYADRRLDLYRSFLEGVHLPVSAKAAVRLFSLAARRRAEAATHGSERDHDFAAKIMDSLAPNGSGWAAVVVGANHTAAVESSMRIVLESHGYSCDMTVL